MDPSSLKALDENIRMIFFSSKINRIIFILSSFKKSRISFLLEDFKRLVEENKKLIYYESTNILKSRIILEKDLEVAEFLSKLYSRLTFFLKTLIILEEMIKNDRGLNTFGSRAENLLDYLEREGSVIHNYIEGMIEMGYFYFQLN